MDPITAAMLAQGASAGIGLAGSLFGGRKRNNPGNAAMEQMRGIPQYGYNAYNPFINAGAMQEPQLRGQYEQMAYNPMGVLGGHQAGYTESPGYKYMFDKLNKEAGNTAAAGGYAGTDEDIRGRSEMHAGLLDNYMQQYLNNIFNLQGQGLGGLEKRSDRGFTASGALADYLGGYGGAMGAYAGYGRAHQNEANQNTWSALSDLIGVGIGAMGKKPGGVKI
jgi:hypothetical protein